MRVAICVTTFRRPAGLRNLLTSLTRLQGKNAAAFSVVVVDNDADKSAQTVVQELSPELNYPIGYFVEPRQGLTYARNAALERGMAAGAIAFLDDDEEADPGWLSTSVDTLRKYSADVVTGPVLSRFSDPPAAWILAGGFFDRPRPLTGDVLTEARTGNVLMRTDMLRETGLCFDHRFALSGGEDADFFRRLRAAGMKIVACDEAIVYETVPTSRANVSWLLRRALRIANCDAQYRLDQSPSPLTRIGLFALGCARIAKNAAASVAAPLLPKHVRVRLLQGICRGLGTCMAALGLQYNEYKNVPLAGSIAGKPSRGVVHA